MPRFNAFKTARQISIRVNSKRGRIFPLCIHEKNAGNFAFVVASTYGYESERVNARAILLRDVGRGRAIRG